METSCRACMSQLDSNKMIFMFESAYKVAEIFSKCVSLDIHELDGLPVNICFMCHVMLTGYNNFRLKCSASDAYFRQKISPPLPAENIECLQIDQNGATAVKLENGNDDDPLYGSCYDGASNDDDESCGYNISHENRLDDHLNQHQGLKKEYDPPLLDSFNESKDSMPLYRAKRNRRIYDLKGTYPDEMSALVAVQQDFSWSKKQKIQTSHGVKQFFRCKKVKSRGKPCAAAAFLLYDGPAENVKWFESQSEHDCDQSDNKVSCKMTAEVQQVVRDMFEGYKTCKPIVARLAQLNLPVPKEYQINNELNRLRHEKYSLGLTERLEINELNSIH